MNDAAKARTTISATIDKLRGAYAGFFVALSAFVFGWVLSGPRFNALINWDNGAYVAAISTGIANWSGSPGLWNAHLGILHVYLLGWWVAHALGGTVIDGLRLGTAVFYAAGCLVLFITARRITGRTLLGVAFAAAWGTAWVNFHYLLILEDNPLFLAPAAGVICVCLLRADDWRVRDSLVAGALACAAFLGSWQAIPYLFPPCYAALLAPRQSLAKRIGLASLVVAGALATIFAWMFFIAATSQETVMQLMQTVFSRPQPSGLPKTSAELMHQLVDFKSMLETLGNSLAYHITFNAYNLPHGAPLPLLWLGVMVVVTLLAIFVVATVWSWRARRSAPHVLAATLVLFSYLTALYHDIGYTALKRFDFVPLLIVALALFAYGELQRRQPSWRRDTLVGLGLLLFTLLQIVLGLQWTRTTRAAYLTKSPWGRVPHAPTMVYGREGRSWYDYFRSIRVANPDACLYVFSLAELYDGNWNLDITGSLWSELPRHLALTNSELAKAGLVPEKWRFRLSFATVRDARAQSRVPSCAWISTDARAMLNNNKD